ncbi:MAG TPA: cytochrome c biogenesis protein CcsA [Chitinophagaceae bacterium]|nr:cytochrome c biogenesis protein CcsA [Chitinophagaceae bacterium]
MDIQFLNEQLWPGRIGQFLTITALVSALFASVSYFLYSRQGDTAWKRSARILFITHGLSVAGIFLTLFYIIFNHRFEYHYAWSHSSVALPFKYLLSCFWEGQEGSFLLWSTWNVVFSLFVIRKNNKWEGPVMTIVLLAQTVLSSMLLGLYFLGQKVGSDPFILLRDQMASAPIFQQADYLNFIKDGNGLNPLLQNYWMVIHPPVLFGGFATTLFPFAYAVACLWKKDYQDFIQPMLRWSVFSGMILGTGIMMGGAWAYESLNFGGYWAWDPVENASLVPWLVMIAGLHTLMVYKASAYSLKSTFLFFILAFSLVIYSSFLTRTGILGETSVHAFTGEGNSLFYHLLIFLFVFLIPALVLFFLRYRSIPDTKKEEEAMSSREFWMFIGALVLMISVVQITYTTSMPVWNKLFGSKLTITDPVSHYNKIQLWITLLVLLGTGLVYYLKFKQSNLKEAGKKLLLPALISLVVTTLVLYFQQITSIPVAMLMGVAVFSALANFFYIIRVLKTNYIKWGGSISHLGFSLMIVGIILSSFNKRVISVNRMGVDFDMGKKTDSENKKESRENVLLFRNMPQRMENYLITYIGDTVVGPNHYYRIRYQKQANDSGKVSEQFVLEPNAQINPKMGLISSPDTRHYLTHDIFTYITSTVDKSKQSDTTAFESKKMKAGDTIFLTTGYVIFNGFTTDVRNKFYQPQEGDIPVAARLEIHDLQGSTRMSEPVYFIRSNREEWITDTIPEHNLSIRMTKVIPAENAALIEYRQSAAMNDYVIMKAILFPYINVLWIGTILMVGGMGISLRKRIVSK